MPRVFPSPPARPHHLLSHRSTSRWALPMQSEGSEEGLFHQHAQGVINLLQGEASREEGREEESYPPGSTVLVITVRIFVIFLLKNSGGISVGGEESEGGDP